MKKLIFAVVMMLVAGVFLSGCSKAAPSCGDKATIDLVKQITKKEAESKIPVTDTVVTVDAIRTTSKDSNTGAQSCAADIVLESKKMKDNGVTLPKIPITYKSELTDSKEHYVTVKGL